MDYEAFLHDRGLKVFAPYEQIDLLPLEKVEPPTGTVAIRNRYHFAQQKVFCHICGRRLHNHGYTAEIADGALILFGSTCAKGYFDDNVLRQAENAFLRRESEAFSEFLIRRVKGTAREIQLWLARNEHLLGRVSDTWMLLFEENKKTFNELFYTLEKNHFRLTEEFIEEASEISREVGRHRRVVTTRIVCAVKNRIEQKALRELRDHVQVVSALPGILLEMPNNAETAFVAELVSKLRSNFTRSMDAIDNALRFSNEIFNEPTFSQICTWSDRQRMIKLQRQANFAPRDLAKILRKKIGYGYELPNPMLRELVGETDPIITGVQSSSANIELHTPR
jgi:hypothetical protein